MAGTLFFAVISFYGWSVGSGLDRSGNVTMAASSPEGSRPLPTEVQECRGRTCAARNLTAKAILPESRGPGVPGPYKYCDFVWNFFGSFFAKKEQTPVKNPNPASAPR